MDLPQKLNDALDNLIVKCDFITPPKGELLDSIYDLRNLISSINGGSRNYNINRMLDERTTAYEYELEQLNTKYGDTNMETETFDKV